MLLWIILFLVIVYTVLTPLSDGLYDTSLWLAKITMPVYSDQMKDAKQLCKITQAAYMDRWLSTTPFVKSILFIGIIILSFLYVWWLALIVFIVFGFIGALFKRFNKPVSYFLNIIYGRMVNRVADYKKNNDMVRAEACEEHCRELESIMLIYLNSNIKVPSSKIIKDNPYGDKYYLWDLYEK